MLVVLIHFMLISCSKACSSSFTSVSSALRLLIITCVFLKTNSKKKTARTAPMKGNTGYSQTYSKALPISPLNHEEKKIPRATAGFKHAPYSVRPNPRIAFPLTIYLAAM